MNDQIIYLEPGKKATTNHNEIKRWIVNHGGSPAIFDDPQAKADLPSIHVDFPGDRDAEYMQEAVVITKVSWEEFFKKFEEKKLAFIYEPDDKIEDITLAFKFVKRDRITPENLHEEVDF